jgi:hypothetical protein
MRTAGIVVIIALSLAAIGQDVAGADTTEPSGSSPALVYLEDDKGPDATGKPLKMTFTETKREGNESTVEVKLKSGGSVSASMFQAKGVCLIAKLRKAKYFWEKGEPTLSGDISVSIYVFSNTRANDEAMSLADCETMGLLGKPMLDKSLERTRD